MTIAAPRGYITHTHIVSVSHAHTLLYKFLPRTCTLSVSLSLCLSNADSQTWTQSFIRGCTRTPISHSNRGKLHPQINTLMEFHTFIWPTHLTLQPGAWKGSMSWRKSLPVYMSLNMAEVQEINTAEFSQSKRDILNVINAVDCSLYQKARKKERNYYNLQGVFCKAEYALINFQNLFQIQRSKLSASPLVMIDMPVFASFIEREWNTIVRS